MDIASHRSDFPCGRANVGNGAGRATGCPPETTPLEDYDARFGSEAGVFAALVYDAIQVFLDAIEETGTTLAGIKGGLQ